MLKRLALLASIVAASGHSADAKVVEETISVAVEVTTIRGEVVRQPIQVTIVRDDTRPRAPFLILNHGRSSDPAKRAALKPAQYAANARYFVSRGYAVFLPLRVGYGATGGPDVENSGACAARVFRPVYEAAATQSVAVIAHAKTLPFVDPARGIVVGQSFGGVTAIALAARNIPGVLAAVNFAGGGGGRPDTHPAQPCSADRMTQLFASYGASARIPTLWLYSENDKYWGAALPRAWHKAFTDRGGTGRFVPLPPHKADGHATFTGNRAAWQGAFEGFLDACCKGETAGRR